MPCGTRRVPKTGWRPGPKSSIWPGQSATTGASAKAGQGRTGPALISNYDVAAVLSELLGRTITYRELSFEENKYAMTGAGIPEQIAEMNAQASSFTASGDAEWISDDVQALLGRPARSFEQFAADYATTFS